MGNREITILHTSPADLEATFIKRDGAYKAANEITA